MLPLKKSDKKELSLLGKTLHRFPISSHFPIDIEDFEVLGVNVIVIVIEIKKMPKEPLVGSRKQTPIVRITFDRLQHELERGKMRQRRVGKRERKVFV